MGKSLPPGERRLINGIIKTTPSPLKGESWGWGENSMILSSYKTSSNGLKLLEVFLSLFLSIPENYSI